MHPQSQHCPTVLDHVLASFVTSPPFPFPFLPHTVPSPFPCLHQHSPTYRECFRQGYHMVSSSLGTCLCSTVSLNFPHFHCNLLPPSLLLPFWLLPFFFFSLLCSCIFSYFFSCSASPVLPTLVVQGGSCPSPARQAQDRHQGTGGFLSCNFSSTRHWFFGLTVGMALKFCKAFDMADPAEVRNGVCCELSGAAHVE